MIRRYLQLPVSLPVLSWMLFSVTPASAVTWDAQAERLQLVSASLLDATPLSSPGTDGYTVTAKSVISTLPKMNATVGGKTEQPPQPPVHAVPTAEVQVRRTLDKTFGFSVRAWGGYLPGAAAAATGMTASCEQSIYGGSLGAFTVWKDVGTAALELGQQRNHAQIKGGITEAKAQDSFDVQTSLNVLGLTLSPAAIPGLWVQGQRIARHVSTIFDIPSDGTKFELTDRSSLTSGNAGSQVAVGFDFKNHVTAAVAYSHVPERVSMPRFLVSYHVPVGGTEGGAL